MAATRDDEDDQGAGLALAKKITLALVLLGIGLGLGFFVPYLIAVDKRVADDFSRLSWQVPSRVYARPLLLAAGAPLNAAALEMELAASRYRKVDRSGGAGTFSREGDKFAIATRGFVDVDGVVPPGLALVTFAEGRIASVRDAAGQGLEGARLDPARIATLYGIRAEERQLVRLGEVPELLLATLIAVEDQDFRRHHGLDFSGIARAALANLRAGEIEQGASTLTQQLVRNLYLTREQKLWRKIKEASYALVMEARFDKDTILEAYLNEIYLGQHGGQAIHGIAAASDYWFGKELAQLEPGEIATLIGMIRGPSYYDPRRHPERTRTRRDMVLARMAEAGLIDQAMLARERDRPLGNVAAPSLARDRYPSFLDRVRRELATDWPDDALKGAGLAVMTSLAPMTQQMLEAATTKELAALAIKDRPPLQAAAVVTDTRTGEVTAMVGDLHAGAQGFNRALDAKRPVGSLMKPFVYMLALAQPGRFSLGTPLQDQPITVPLTSGRTWKPKNSDNKSHGTVPLIDALSKSYNQATVSLGTQVGFDRIARLIEAIADLQVAPNPSLVLGSVDLSVFDMARLYQFIAAGGQLQPVRTVRAVLDARGLPLSRYDRPLPPPEEGDTIAAKLVTLALQQAVESGTARRLLADGLGKLSAAGKTGTSNDSRDSWFAGYTGRDLAVIWVGNDANEPTGLYGSSGAMRVWSTLFKTLPTEPLAIDTANLEWAWVSPHRFATTRPDCPGARKFAFVQGFTPEDYASCVSGDAPDWGNAVAAPPGGDDRTPIRYRDREPAQDSRTPIRYRDREPTTSGEPADRRDDRRDGRRRLSDRRRD